MRPFWRVRQGGGAAGLQTEVASIVGTRHDEIFKPARVHAQAGIAAQVGQIDHRATHKGVYRTRSRVQVDAFRPHGQARGLADRLDGDGLR